MTPVPNRPSPSRKRGPENDNFAEQEGAPLTRSRLDATSVEEEKPSAGEVRSLQDFIQKQSHEQSFPKPTPWKRVMQKRRAKNVPQEVIRKKREQLLNLLQSRLVSGIATDTLTQKIQKEIGRLNEQLMDLTLRALTWM